MNGRSGVAGAHRYRPIRWLREHPDHADLLLAILITTIAVTFHLLDFDPENIYVEPAWWTVVLVFASVFPIAWRRRAPIASTAIVVAAFLVAAVAEVDGSGFLGVVVALYSLGAHGDGRARTRAILVTTASILLLFAAGYLADEVGVGDLISTSVVLVTAYVLGDNLRRRRLAADDLQSRLERAERERDLLAQQRVSDERARIARELHDVVAHSVTGMVIQAAAARRSLDRSPADAAAALDSIESTGRRTMNELRSVLGVLRRDEDEDVEHRAPQPGLARLAELIESSCELPVDLTIDGLEPNTLGCSNPGLDVTVFRLVQEALTNVRRHAGTVTRVEVAVKCTDRELTVTVTDDGAGTGSIESDPGYGLIGMRERVDTVGGTLTAGPWGSAGWRLAATIPVADMPDRLGPEMSGQPR